MDSADIMTIFASTRGNTAGCDEKKGSYLIQTFLKVLIKTTKDKNLTDIMKKVQRKINRTQTPESNFTFSRSYYIKSDTELNALLELEKELQEVVKGWLRLREQTIKQIRELAEMLQEHHRIINKFQIIGFVICSIGVFFILIGSAIDFGITPFTFGINVACIGIAITVGVPFFYSYVIENMKIEKAQKKYSEDHRQLKNLQETIKKMENIVENVYKSNTQIWQIKQNADNFVSTMKLLYPNSTKGSLCRIITQLAMAESLEVGTSALRNGGLKAALALVLTQ
ncbi:PREDICTED: uncharacterized protein LOC109592848 isoform X2 [Amphimedon queenslandica]|uniref:Caspase family p10 domain-containing protein n=1 Tax=Amphimedon queenslandica TaxID=400682 RepID=A0AAN0K3J9_AMPQE|nr:PREDICTED: uncharacterized protein LOC109592848 isoform X2 [Amphimedon queenslandica]|eukprot:XP_019863748.1 PREDICTED: uncharacterized protein LOC109592848 isoform X2 [Amphimedon queenslandica]